MTLEDYIAKYDEKNGTLRWRRNEAVKRWRQTHQEELLKYKKQYIKCWRQTPYGRAVYLVQGYRRKDRLYNRGKCTLTAQWIMDNIFTRRCLYCGEADWKLLGCDRIDNSKPHTPGNVVCCCGKCNDKRMHKSFLDFAYSMGAKDSEGLTIE